MHVSIVRRKVKNARVQIGPDMIVKVIIPMRYTQANLDLLLREKAAWIDKAIDFYAKRSAEVITLPNGEILYMGSAMCVEFDTSNADLLEKWYRKKAREYYSLRLAELAAQHGFIYNRLFIRGSKTRWGTCSRKKDISLNWRLMKSPSFVIDYLILHELVHTVHFNHSQQYWQKVEKVCPDFREAKKWLKIYGHTLH